MKVQIIWNYYPELLCDFSKKHPDIGACSFAEQQRRLLDQHYGWPGELCEHMVEHGIEASFYVGNAEFLQKQWAREAGFTAYAESNWEKEILLEQIKRVQPDVLWLNCSFNYVRDFVRVAGENADKLVTWMGSPFREDVDVEGFSVLLTENPLTLKSKQHRFEQVVVTKPGFDRRLIERIGPVQKKRDVVFVGQISGAHTWRAELLCDLLAQGISVDVFAFITPGEDPDRAALMRSFVRAIRYGDLKQARHLLGRILGPRRYTTHRECLASVSQGPVFGLDMYRVMAEARLVVNTHIDVAGDNAGNMRMFECTGIGTCLVTEDKKNLELLFTPGVEVLTYTSRDSLIQAIRDGLREPECTEAIARAGQARTGRDHSLGRMLDDILPALSA